MNFNCNKILPAAIALALSHSAFAQSQETELEPVVVTANRVARTADETLTSVTVITRKQIEQQQAKSVAELLRGLPGVQFSNAGGAGKATSLYLRGSESDHTLMLIDGVKVGSATMGDIPLQDIPVDMIERIEIVRGPRASLYGSEAIGGVIQIFTRKGAQPASFSLGGGSRGTYETSAQGGFGSPDAWLNVGASGVTTRGINATNGGNNSDRDGYTRSAMNVRGGGRIGEKLDFDLQAQHAEGRNEQDAYNSDASDMQQDLYAGNLRLMATDSFTSSVKLTQTLNASQNLKDDKFVSRFDTRRSTASWQNDLTLAKGHQLVGGADYQYDEVMVSTDYTATKRTNKAVFAQYLADLGNFDLQLAGRHDKNEQYGHHNTGSAALGYTFSPALRLRASHGTAFKAPSFNALYYTDAYGSNGNPDLQPEESRSSELGASGKSGTFDWQASLFSTRLKNKIDWAETSPGSYAYTPINVARADIKGLELNASQSFGDTKVAASASFLSPRARTDGDDNGKLLVRRARQSTRLDIDHKLAAWSFGGSLLTVGKRYEDTANTTKLGGYATVDLRAEYTFNPEWRVQTRIENLLDKRYETSKNFNQPGIGAFVTVRYQPK